MAHAKAKDMEDVAELLKQVRALPDLKEKSFGCFYRKSKALLHFHVQGGRRFAHVYDGKAWAQVELPEAPSVKQQNDIFKSILKITLF